MTYKIKIIDSSCHKIHASDLLELMKKINGLMSDQCIYEDEIVSIEPMEMTNEH